MADDKDREWAKQVVACMKSTGERFWLAGKAHCIVCNHEVMMICPHPVGLEPNAECEKCGEMLVVFDGAEEMKITIAKKDTKTGLDEQPG
jgi:hypothetical protein